MKLFIILFAIIVLVQIKIIGARRRRVPSSSTASSSDGSSSSSSKSSPSISIGSSSTQGSTKSRDSRGAKLDKNGFRMNYSKRGVNGFGGGDVFGGLYSGSGTNGIFSSSDLDDSNPYGSSSDYGSS